MRIEFIGHACFLITWDNGKRVLTDPYKKGAFGAIHYKNIDIECDIITVSHEHLDHNFTEGIGGNPHVVKGTGEREIEGLKITGFPSYHDKSKGKERGENTIFLIEGEISVVHFGDIGDIPQDSVLEELKNKEVVLIPTGGLFTIGPEEATEIIRRIKPRVVIPMHYKTPLVGFDLLPVNEFLKGKNYKNVGNMINIKKETLPHDTEVWVMDYAR